MKTCSKCGDSKPATAEYFYKQRGCRDFLRPDCKTCVRARALTVHYADHEASKERIRSSYAKHREKRKASLKLRYRAKRSLYIASAKMWAKQNREKVYSYQHNWRAAQRSGGKHTAEQIAALFAQQRGLCANCHNELRPGFHRDHVMPLKLGGSNDISNIQLLCPSCNCSKGAKHPFSVEQQEHGAQACRSLLEYMI